MTLIGNAPMKMSHRLMMGLYQLFWYLALPLALGRLLWKGRLQKGYREHINERLGMSWPIGGTTPRIWVHAVSVGETRAAAPLIDALIQSGEKILLTHMTPTGRDTGRQLFADHIASGQLVQSYLPYDIHWAVNSFYQYFSIKVGLIMETEVWPSLILSAHQKSLPVILINARLSERSTRRVSRFSNFAQLIYQSFTKILAQTNLDAKRYNSLGLSNVMVTGNLKFDVTPNLEQIEHALALKKKLTDQVQIVCAASTRDGEEALIIEAWQAFLKTKENPNDFCLLIVPRHPQRFDDVFAQLQSSFTKVSRRSNLGDQQFTDVINHGGVILGDSMGEMSFYYALSDVVIMGGSLLPLGGQNFIEACALGRPIILGEHTFNFQQASTDVIDSRAAIRISDVDELVKAVDLLLTNHQVKEDMSTNALDFANQHTGATKKIVAVVRETLS
ncbi:3-deoxy-D-manno-octulosonic acid transferase [Polynucleobacter sp. AM-26B4]|uniref:3-deoxy-D-manno-octulosonic acid transferase n=1 Tax=Polynucleobacter sp. AM-26B4 TaxID=2689103 RepID=UPI002105E96D|nr:3-deoxy-D-manno-octulosonic acid transferase [Polynucleobacter sp. AM-26B4]